MFDRNAAFSFEFTEPINGILKGCDSPLIVLENKIVEIQDARIIDKDNIDSETRHSTRVVYHFGKNGISYQDGYLKAHRVLETGLLLYVHCYYNPDQLTRLIFSTCSSLFKAEEVLVNLIALITGIMQKNDEVIKNEEQLYNLGIEYCTESRVGCRSILFLDRQVFY